MDCGHECYRVGGPWIAENPACPIHGADGQRHDRDLDQLSEQVEQAESIEELRELMLEMIEIMRG